MKIFWAMSSDMWSSLRHAADEVQERGVVAHEELFIGADIAPNDRGDQFAVVLLSAESEFHGRLSGFAYVPCGGLRFKR